MVAPRPVALGVFCGDKRQGEMPRRGVVLTSGILFRRAASPARGGVRMPVWLRRGIFEVARLQAAAQ